jgi:hypothetical protein
MTDPSSPKRGRPTSTNPQLFDSNTNVVLDPRDGRLTPRQTGRLTVGRNIILTLTKRLKLVGGQAYDRSSG